MAKRVSRLKTINHEINQLDMLRDLTPNTTPPNALPLSNTLLDVAQEALHEIGRLEDGEPPELKRLGKLMTLINSLPEKANS